MDFQVSNPDMLLPEKKIQVGPLYTVAAGDTLLSVAATMKTTVKMIMQNNPTIPDDGMIQPGKLSPATDVDLLLAEPQGWFAEYCISTALI